MSLSSWKKISSTTAYQNKYFTVREDDVVKPNGEKGTYFVIELAQSVMIVAVTKDNEVYMVGQQRYTTNM
jgi:hypothetical protein